MYNVTKNPNTWKILESTGLYKMIMYLKFIYFIT